MSVARRASWPGGRWVGTLAARGGALPSTGRRQPPVDGREQHVVLLVDVQPGVGVELGQALVEGPVAGTAVGRDREVAGVGAQVVEEGTGRLVVVAQVGEAGVVGGGAR